MEIIAQRLAQKELTAKGEIIASDKEDEIVFVNVMVNEDPPVFQCRKFGNFGDYHAFSGAWNPPFLSFNKPSRYVEITMKSGAGWQSLDVVPLHEDLSPIFAESSKEMIAYYGKHYTPFGE